jgi:hypothetical protein
MRTPKSQEFTRTTIDLLYWAICKEETYLNMIDILILGM